MVDRDVVLAKVATIDRCLERIGDVRGGRQPPLLPVDVDDIVMLNLQRGVQAAIDLAAHVVASEGYGLPDSVAGTFSLLQSHGVIDSQVAADLRRMVGFRNVAVHSYQAVDPAIVEAILARHLDQLRAFARIIATRFAS